VSAQPAPSPSSTGAQSTALSGDTASSGASASQEDVNATLDDILKELNNLDQLFSQMDNIKDSDLN
jgi:hypothetical protein